MSVIVFHVPFRNVIDISFGKCWVQNKLQINKNLAAYICSWPNPSLSQ